MGQPEREPRLLLSLYFGRNERVVANSAVMQKLANFRVGDNSPVEIFIPAPPLKIHSVIPLLSRELDVVRFRHLISGPE